MSSNDVPCAASVVMLIVPVSCVGMNPFGTMASSLIVAAGLMMAGPALGAVVLAHRGDPARALETLRHSRAWEDHPGPVEGQIAEALVTAGAVDEGQALAGEVLKRAPGWRMHGLRGIP